MKSVGKNIPRSGSVHINICIWRIILIGCDRLRISGKNRNHRNVCLLANTFNHLYFHILSGYLYCHIYDGRFQLSMNRFQVPRPEPKFLSQPENSANPSSDPKIPNSIPQFSRKRFCSSGHSTRPTSPLSKSISNCRLSASFHNSLSSNRPLHSHSSFRSRCSSRISLTVKSSRPRFRHSLSRYCQGFQFQFLGSWSWPQVQNSPHLRFWHFENGPLESDGNLAWRFPACRVQRNKGMFRMLFVVWVVIVASL